MSKRRITLFDPGNSENHHRRIIEEDNLRIKSADIELRAHIASATLSQNEAQFQVTNRRLERKDEDDRRLGEQANAIAAKRNEITAKNNDDQIALGKAKLELDREKTYISARTALETAVIQSRTALEIADKEQKGALERAVLAHYHDIAVKTLAHTQDMTLLREKKRLEDIQETANVAREEAYSIIRRTEYAINKHHDTVSAIALETVRGRIAERLENQRERHRENERRHEKDTDMNTARYSRVGFTIDELKRAGYSDSDARDITRRLIEKITDDGGRSDMSALAAKCLDEWERERTEKA